MSLIVAVDENWAIGYNNELSVSLSDHIKFQVGATKCMIIIRWRESF